MSVIIQPWPSPEAAHHYWQAKDLQLICNTSKSCVKVKGSLFVKWTNKSQLFLSPWASCCWLPRPLDNPPLFPRHSSALQVASHIGAQLPEYTLLCLELDRSRANRQALALEEISRPSDNSTNCCSGQVRRIHWLHRRLSRPRACFLYNEEFHHSECENET